MSKLSDAVESKLFEIDGLIALMHDCTGDYERYVALSVEAIRLVEQATQLALHMKQGLTRSGSEALIEKKQDIIRVLLLLAISGD